SLPMLIALRSPKGTQRLEVGDTEKLASLYSRAAKTLGLPESSFQLNRRQANGKQQALPRSRTQSVASVGLKHGDSLFVRQNDSAGEPSSIADSLAESSIGGASVAASVVSAKAGSASTTPDDPLDVELDREDGRIIRKRDPKMCRHSDGAGCLHCAPLEPYDSEYLASLDPPVKYLPFHAFLRKIQAEKYSGALANVSARKKPGCRNHDSTGICSACMPDPLTLEQQGYRHVDYLQFEHPSIVDRFVNYWRRSGHQRIGYLVGRYERHAGVSLGIKAVVAAIYEPPQQCHKHRVLLEPEDPHKPALDALLDMLGMQLVGWVFTDLLPADESGKVLHFRGTGDTFFLSAEEAITAGQLQVQHPNICSKAEGGRFGSKFVTCVLTGDQTNQIAPTAYQLSNQGMALVRDEILVPTFDAPELAWCRERTKDGQFAPDVFYSGTNEYGNRMKRLARPLPVDFLLIDMPVGFAKDASEHACSFQPADRFPIENRASIGGETAASSLRDALETVSGRGLAVVLSDFHLLFHLLTDPVIAFPPEQLRELLRHVMSGDSAAAEAFVNSCPNWEVVKAVAFSQSGAGWQCRHCTFQNSGGGENAACEICGLPQ
ncbi:hypothetical protein BOX15_Mlig004860g4, partial [Macrostomum lignano]